ncbi:MAG: DUF484 family protein [Syntrophales bacterium]|nr:DUF484 family protein [Syntrophales bacterium]
MKDILKINAEIAARFGELKRRINRCTTVESVFIAWREGMEKAFAIPFLWITIIEDDLSLPVRKALDSSDFFRHSLNIVSREIFESLTANRQEPILVSENIRPYLPLFPRHKYLLRSMAIAPFSLGDEVVGSLNHGDPSPYRYIPEMDTTLLASLAHSVSRRLTELIYFP